MKAYTRSEDIASLILNLSTRQNAWSASHPGLQGKSPTYPLNRRLVGPHNQSEYFGGEIKSLTSARI
jgi:hypothetical protein